MQLIRNFQNINKEVTSSVLTLGNFDGLHLGHREILKQVREIAKNKGLKSALLTFEPHPMKITNPEKAAQMRIYSLSQKLRIIRDENLVDLVFIAHFNKKLANLEAGDFVKNILVNSLKINHLIIGYDFIFGKNRGGNANLLEGLSKIYHFGFDKISAEKNNSDQIYSSTAIRKLINSGSIKELNLMLGSTYQISGTIISGKKIARNIGFPTANILPKNDSAKLKYGVYKATAKLESKAYKAIVNFGIKPTFNENTPLFEVHIFNFNQDIYGKKLTLELLDFIREEKKFSGLDELKEQIKKDCIIAQN